MPSKDVKITKDGIEATCLPESVKAYERNGWTVVDDGSSESAPEAEAPAESKPTGRTKTKE